MTAVRQLTELADLVAVEELYEQTWKVSPVSAKLLRALTMAGGYVAGAFDDAGLIGASVGFCSPPSARELHSHVTAVAAGVRGRNVGYALKLDQRAWALQHGITEISWTFDPLVRRNAYFNLVKLGAEVAGYLPDCYGPMDDAINRGDESDRLLVRWRLDSAPVPQRGSTVRVAVPEDIEALRANDPARARRWRLDVREELGGLLAGGARVTGFDRAGWYIVERNDA
ncbi:GNAT family N-acetyltransferase [Lentzea sp. NPDC051213]|uniref:GNAT family N-acetyltransferase n=1 Tax=Lentzea sp. NPDC051213 TaxID=3364126 RepID=UPI00379C87AC